MLSQVEHEKSFITLGPGVHFGKKVLRDKSFLVH